MPASMGSSARRLRREPFDELSPRILCRGTPAQSGNRQTAINSRHTLIEIKIFQVPLEGEGMVIESVSLIQKQHREDNENCVDRHWSRISLSRMGLRD